jgi:predicted RNA methylase
MATSKNLNKDSFDRFYTKPSVVDDLLKIISIKDYDVVVEPSAGTGSWSSRIEDCIAIDIAPEHPDIMKGDFLKDDFLFEEMKKENKILVIGNPPFGKMGKAAVDFFNKAAEFADTIAFILPRSFRKETLQRRLDKKFWLIKDVDLYKKDYFIFDDHSWHTSCVFQVWVKSTEERDTDIRKIINPIGFSYVTTSATLCKDIYDSRQKKIIKSIKNYVKQTDANLVVRRVGGAAGRAFVSKIEERAVEGNYFLWVDDPSTIAAAINNHRFSPNVYDTVGPESLTKGELTTFINSLTNH